MKNTLVALVTVLTCLSPSVLHAAPSGTLSFLQPSGEVGPTDTIPVWIRLTLNSSSDPLAIDNEAGSVITNLPAMQLTYFDTQSGQTKSSYGSFTSISNVSFEAWIGCSGNFTNGCNPGAYSFAWNNGADSVYSFSKLSLQPGESIDYLPVSFVPEAPVATGAYILNYSSLFLQLTGTARGIKYDSNGNPLLTLDGDGKPILDVYGNPVYEQFTIENAKGGFQLAETICANNPLPCATAFTRNVSAVPLPTTAWLFGSGLLALGGAARRKTRRASA